MEDFGSLGLANIQMRYQFCKARSSSSFKPMTWSPNSIIQRSWWGKDYSPCAPPSCETLAGLLE
eukprot:14611164-Alexandrium_andersonii.AAC.1